MKKILIGYIICIGLSACGSGDYQGGGTSPSVPEKEASDSSDLIVIPSDNDQLTVGLLTIPRVILAMKTYSRSSKTIEATARGFDKMYSIQCNPNCTIKRK